MSYEVGKMSLSKISAIFGHMDLKNLKKFNDFKLKNKIYASVHLICEEFR